MIRYTDDGRVDRAGWPNAITVADANDLADALDAATAALRSSQAEVERLRSVLKTCREGFLERGLLVWAAEIDAALAAELVGPARVIAACRVIEEALHAEAWISDAPHGDNCYVSAHYDGDPGNQCNCGKESVLNHLRAALAELEAIE